MSSYILRLACPDKVGIVAAVSNFLADNMCNIQDSAQFGDPYSKQFFMRVHFETTDKALSRTELLSRFATVAVRFDMNWRLEDFKKKARLLVMVSQHGHCLNDLLYRCNNGILNAEIRAIVSNHRVFEELSGQNGIPFYYLPVTQENKKQQEEQVIKLAEGLEIDLIILARYMQILSPEFCKNFKDRIINIHHSFLPGFKGAKPYHQAYARGVKIIGATAHYVTESLDEGPIIEQEIERVDHSQDPDELVSVGRDLESLVLAKAVRYHVEQRILLNGNKTVVFK